MILSGNDLMEAVANGDIEIDPPPPDSAIEPASIDLALGREAFRAVDDQKTLIDEGEILHLPAGGFAIVLTKESLELGPDVAGAIGLRSKFTREGIDLLAGPQIDPGFKGPLHLTLVNLSPSSVSLSEGDRFCTVEFHRVSTPVDDGYDGEFQEQYHITTEEINNIKQDDFALSELHQSMSSIAQNVSKMEENYEKLSNRVNTQMWIFISSIVALVAAIIADIIGIV